jgi:hypothetical protein
MQRAQHSLVLLSFIGAKLLIIWYAAAPSKSAGDRDTSTPG